LREVYIVKLLLGLYTGLDTALLSINHDIAVAVGIGDGDTGTIPTPAIPDGDKIYTKLIPVGVI
jgi:hypothetical protein